MTDKLAIIVPYRDRQEHLDVFVPHIHEFLKDKGIDYTIFIAEQTDDRPFNYGKLCNIATKEVGEEYTYFAFHDIDMLPISDDCDYGYPDSPTHLATNVEAHNNELPYPQYFGGVVLISREDFEKANGYSNEYWGYGFQDLDLLYRLQRSGAYLEKFYDLNQTYEKYDENDVLPYRIENVKITNNKKSHKVNYVDLGKSDYVYGPINKFTLEVLNDDFFVSFWFKDEDKTQTTKNLFSFEGCDSGVFISRGKYIIGQIWNNLENHYEVTDRYYKNKWTHIVWGVSNNKLFTYINNKKINLQLPEDFKIFDYTKHSIKIGDDVNNLKITDVKIFNSKIEDVVSSELYYNGDKVLDLLHNKYGISISNNFKFNKIYKNSILLDSGTNLNHIPFKGNFKNYSENIETTSEIYLPFRLQGEYKSLVHEGDSNIIEKYYRYDPDIEENSDIFFHDVLTGDLDYKSLGLSTLSYTLLDKQDRKDYELIRIVT